MFYFWYLVNVSCFNKAGIFLGSTLAIVWLLVSQCPTDAEVIKVTQSWLQGCDKYYAREKNNKNVTGSCAVLFKEDCCKSEGTFGGGCCCYKLLLLLSFHFYFFFLFLLKKCWVISRVLYFYYFYQALRRCTSSPRAAKVRERESI